MRFNQKRRNILNYPNSPKKSPTGLTIVNFRSPIQGQRICPYDIRFQRFLNEKETDQSVSFFYSKYLTLSTTY